MTDLLKSGRSVAGEPGSPPAALPAYIGVSQISRITANRDFSDPQGSS